MIAWLRFVATVVVVFLHIALGLAIVAFVFPPSGHARRQRCIRWWSGRLLTILRVRLDLIGPEGAARPDVVADAMRVGGRGAMLVLNHVSWLDTFVVHAVRPAHFIAKAEIARWPLLGFLVDRTGAIFIERGKRHAVREVNHRVANVLKQGELVGMFPEGTTGDGERLLPFHANLLQAAVEAGVPIVVAGLRYRDPDGRPTTATRFVGDTTMLESMLVMARRGPLVVELRLIDAMDSRTASRHVLVRDARAMIASAMGYDDEAVEIAESISTVIVVPDVSPATVPLDMARSTELDLRDELL
jgi:1-acyl-sn-glycerol-3-phosphate acyltransferase